MSSSKEEPDEAPRVGSSCVSEVESAVMVVDRVQYVCAMLEWRGIGRSQHLRGGDCWSVLRYRRCEIVKGRCIWLSSNVVVGGVLFMQLQLLLRSACAEMKTEASRCKLAKSGVVCSKDWSASSKEQRTESDESANIRAKVAVTVVSSSRRHLVGRTWVSLWPANVAARDDEV